MRNSVGVRTDDMNERTNEEGRNRVHWVVSRERNLLTTIQPVHSDLLTDQSISKRWVTVIRFPARTCLQERPNMSSQEEEIE
jgi:hypothetical protein